eukprot:Hpha_TRINITY_DN20717_c0_g1::TRINITY_DN20717_c0_g1_i1::g.33382::m.33382
MWAVLGFGVSAALAVSCSGDECRAAGCPEPWAPSQCLPPSGEASVGPQIEYRKGESIDWTAGMEGHSHYKLDPKKTALLVIDAQKVYAACPQRGEDGAHTVERLIASPESEGFDGHSPMCCDRFYEVVEKQNTLADAFRAKGGHVVVSAHVYRDFDGDGEVDNCGRLCDFNPLGWAKWPKAWNLWNAALPWHETVYKTDKEPKGFNADFERDFYNEKSVYSAITKPVAEKLRELGVDTVVVTGFMTQYCCVTTARNAHDLGFRVVFANDATDGPVLAELLSGVDENKIIPFYLGIAVADVSTTDEIIASLSG